MVVAYTIADLIKKGIEILGEGEYNNPLLDSQLLLCHVLNVDKIYTYTHKDQVVDSHSVDKFLKFIGKRRNGYPIQYILEKQEFMGLDFYVKEGVLIPRPDTEILVEYIIDLVNSRDFSHKDFIKIVDIGTGSGAITLSLAHYLENAHLYSIDISDTALQVATENSKRLSLESRVTFIKGDLLNPLDELKLYNSIDIIVSNPPYIPTNDIAALQKEVSEYEPKAALDGGDDGLDFYRRIICESSKYLVDGGVLAFEIGYDQGNDVKELMLSVGEDKGEIKEQLPCPNTKDISCDEGTDHWCKTNRPYCRGFKDIKIIKDLAGHDRVVTGIFSGFE